MVVVSTVVAGGVAAVVVAPLAGVPVGIATFLALVLGYGRAVLALGSVGLLVAVDVMVTGGQGAARYPAEFGWPTHFETAGTLAWLAVVGLAADAVVQEVRGRRRRPAPGPGHRRIRRRRRGKHVRAD